MGSSKRGSGYAILRLLVRPFFFVFGVVFCSLALPFWKTGLNFYSLLLFSLLYAAIFSAPFLFDNLFLNGGKREASLGVFHLKTWKLVCIPLVASLFIAVTAFTAKSVALQISNAGLLGANSVFAATGSLIVISALFIGLFSFTFYFTEPATDSLTSKN